MVHESPIQIRLPCGTVDCAWIVESFVYANPVSLAHLFASWVPDNGLIHLRLFIYFWQLIIFQRSPSGLWSLFWLADQRYAISLFVFAIDGIVSPWNDIIATINRTVSLDGTLSVHLVTIGVVVSSWLVTTNRLMTTVVPNGQVVPTRTITTTF